MRKIVINTCYGGFGLSHEAVLRYAELVGLSLSWQIDDISTRIYKQKAVVDNPSVLVHYYTSMQHTDENYWSGRDIVRDDTRLVQVIEELGSEANGRFASLVVVEIPDDVEWQIEEYDGFEHIAEKHRTWN